MYWVAEFAKNKKELSERMQIETHIRGKRK